MNYTKGQWKVNKTGPNPWDLDVVDEHGRTLATMGEWTETPANARVMALAPQLCAALKDLLELKNHPEEWNYHVQVRDRAAVLLAEAEGK